MTVAVQDPINQFIIAGGETTGPWTWQLNQAADLTVFKTLASTGEVVPLTLNTDYSVNPAGLGTKSGGTINFLAPQIPAVAGDIWTLQRDTELRRAKDFATSGDFLAVTVNPQFDDPILITQDIERDVAQALRKNPGVGDTLNPLIPQPVDRRAAIFSDTGGGNFELVMSELDPDEAAGEAEGFAEDAEQSANESAASAAAALVSENNAKTSEDNAKISEDNAKTSETNAGISETNSASSAADALTSENNAKTSEDNAKISEDNAATSESNAATSETNAATSETNAGISETNAETSANSAAESAASANSAAATVAGAKGLYSNVISLLTADAAFSGNSFIHGDDNLGRAFVWNDLGTKFYIIGTGNDTVFEYTVSIPFDLNSAIVQTNSLDVNSEESTPTGLAWNNDGTQLFVSGRQNESIYEYSVDVGFDLGSTVVFVDSFAVSTQDINPESVSFNNTGSKMFVVGDENNKVYEYALSPAFDITSAVFTTDFIIGSEDGSATGLAWNNDGTTFFMVGNQTNTVYQYTLSIGFDLSSGVVFNGNSLVVTAQDASPHAIAFNNNGNKFYVLGATNQEIFEYNATGTYSLAAGNTVYTNESFDLSGQQANPADIRWNNEGTKFFIVGNSPATLFEYTVSVPFNLSSTVNYSGNSFSVNSEEPQPNGLFFNNDGTKFFIVGSTNDTVFEYTVSVGFDLSSTVAYSNNSFSVASEETNPLGLAFNNDGTKFFIVGSSGIAVFEYTVSVGFDLSSTVAFSNNSFDLSPQAQTPQEVVFNNDGTKFFIIDDDDNIVFEYTVSVGFDMSSIVAFSGNSFSVESEDLAAFGLAFNNDGTKFFIAGQFTATVYEYLTANPFSLDANAVVVKVVPESNGALFSADTSNLSLDLFLIDSSTLTADFRVGVVKNSVDSNTLNVNVQGSDTVNGGTVAIVQTTKDRIVPYVLDQSEAKWIGSPLSSPVLGGALVFKSSAQTIPTSSLSALTWQSVEYDDANIHSLSPSPARLTVPDGVAEVVLTGNVNWNINAVGSRTCVIKKNGSAAIGLPEVEISAVDTAFPEQNFTSAVLRVVPGDEFIVEVFQTSGGDLTVIAVPATWFAMRIVTLMEIVE